MRADCSVRGAKESMPSCRKQSFVIIGISRKSTDSPLRYETLFARSNFPTDIVSKNLSKESPFLYSYILILIGICQSWQISHYSGSPQILLQFFCVAEILTKKEAEIKSVTEKLHSTNSKLFDCRNKIQHLHQELKNAHKVCFFAYLVVFFDKVLVVNGR